MGFAVFPTGQTEFWLGYIRCCAVISELGVPFFAPKGNAGEKIFAGANVFL